MLTITLYGTPSCRRYQRMQKLVVDEATRLNISVQVNEISETEQLVQFSPLNGLEPQLASASQSLTEISSDSQVPSEHRNTLNELSIDISGMSNTIQSALEKLDTSVENLSPQTQPSKIMVPHTQIQRFYYCHFALFGLIALLIVVFRYLKKHFKISWQK